MDSPGIGHENLPHAPYQSSEYNPQVLNALTIDVEPWFQTEVVQRTLPPADRAGLDLRLHRGIDPLLRVLDTFDVRATFFVTGEVADTAPRVVLEIARQGHEIACHHLHHERVLDCDPASFRAQVLQARDTLEQASGHPVRGYRAPTWSITAQNLNLLEILDELGFDYDSSIQATGLGPWGIPDLYPYPFRIRGLGLVELPPSILGLGRARLPFAGGFFLRLLPSRLVAHGIRRLNRRGHPAVVHAHNWEFDVALPRLPLSTTGSWVQYHNLGSMEGRLRFLLEHAGPFTTMAEIISPPNQWPEVDLGFRRDAA
ncbi:MAG: polysaccharide deacetylase family protein [Myxococcota bacterium]|nr:polysaccharide deacetylase family protein [Myxococcota bacterium]